MRKSFFAVLLAGVGAMASTSVSAATIGAGQSGCESTSRLAGGIACDITLDADFGQTIAAGDTATFAGSGTLYGYLADAGDATDNFSDAAAITFAQDSFVTFNLISPTAGFDAELTFGGLVVSPVTGASGIIDLGFVAGGTTLSFIVDATSPTNSLDRQASSYALTATVAAVPLPASAFLLLGGMGAMGALRRKAKKAS